MILLHPRTSGGIHPPQEAATIRIQSPQAHADRLDELFRSTDDRKLRDRLQMVLMAHRGRPRQAIAQDQGIHRIGVTRWFNSYHERGLEGLLPQKARARPPRS